MRRCLLLAVLVSLAPWFLGTSSLAAWAAGQRAASGSHSVPHGGAQHGVAQHGVARQRSASFFNSPAGNLVLARNGFPSSLRRSSVSPRRSLPFPFFGDSFDPDSFNPNPDDADASANGLPDPTQSPAFLMQAMRALTGSAADSMGQAGRGSTSPQPSSSAPLLIELQNGRYVRVEGTAVNADAVPLDSAPNSAPNRASAGVGPARSLPSASPAAPPAPPLSPAVLVFRDGHTEEVRDYTISGGMLYARGNYYTDGYWNKTIDLGTVNIAETLQANANRNVKFVLPSSPNEVITRP